MVSDLQLTHEIIQMEYDATKKQLDIPLISQLWRSADDQR